jgi:hypothetical protein
MSLKIKDKFIEAIASHPTLVIFGLGLAMTFVIGTIIGMVNDPTHAASASQENFGNNAKHGR